MRPLHLARTAARAVPAARAAAVGPGAPRGGAVHPPAHRGAAGRVGGDGGGGGSGSIGGGGVGGGGGGGGGSGGGGGRWFGLADLWAAYMGLLASKPLLTKAATSAVLSGGGDALAQAVVEGKPASAFDWPRFGRFSLLGGALVGPALHMWYGALAKHVTVAGTAGALTRLAADQLLFAPLFVGTFFAALLTLEGRPGDAVAKIKADLPSALKANWALWVPANFVNFRFVPPHLQVLFANGVALAWNTYLSIVSNA